MRVRPTLLVAVLAVGSISSGCGGASAGVTGGGAVPWVDRPAPRYTTPVPAPIPYPTGAPRCHQAQLEVHAGRGGVGLGNVLDVFVFTNTSGTPCSVRGFPTITGVTADGHRTRLPTKPAPAGTYFGTLVPADMAPGAHVYLDLATNDVSCIPRQRFAYRDLTFQLPHTGTLATRAHLGQPCNGWLMAPLGLPPRTTATNPPQPGSIDTLRVVLSVPHGVQAGRTLHYIVTLSNPTRTPVRLDPCPGYTESIWAPHLMRRPAFFLNCDTIHSIAPHHRVRYQMQLAIPASSAQVMAKLGWQLDTPDEPSAATALTIDR